MNSSFNHIKVYEFKFKSDITVNLYFQKCVLVLKDSFKLFTYKNLYGFFPVKWKNSV